MFQKYLLVGVGGFLGSISRFFVAQTMQKMLQTTFPYGTLTINIVGSFILGVIYGVGEYFNWLTPNVRLLLAVGFCGGFTTFSTFAYENITLLRDSQYFGFFLYLSVSIIAGLFAAWLGFVTIKSIS